MSEEDILRRVLVALQALREHVGNEVDEVEVGEYHTQLDRLASVGYDVDEWRVPTGWFERHVTQRNRLDPTKTRYSKPSVARSRFLMKLDAVLAFFSIEEDRRIGFEAPKLP